MNKEFLNKKREYEKESVDDSPQTPNEYEVEKVIAKKFCKKTKETLYLIKWIGYDFSNNSWEPISNLENCMELIEDFEEKNSGPKPKKGNPKKNTKNFIQDQNSSCEEIKKNLELIETKFPEKISDIPIKKKQDNKKYEKLEEGKNIYFFKKF